MAVAMKPGGSARPTAGAGSGISVPLPFPLAIRLSADEITVGALPINPGNCGDALAILAGQALAAADPESHGRGGTRADHRCGAAEAGYMPRRWTVDTLGWEGTAGHITVAVVAAWVLAALRLGEMVLMHFRSSPDDQTKFDADALPQVITELRARGYLVVTLDPGRLDNNQNPHSAAAPRAAISKVIPR